MRKQMETHKSQKENTDKTQVLSVAPARAERGTADNLTNWPTITIVFWLCRMGFSRANWPPIIWGRGPEKTNMKRVLAMRARERQSFH